MTFRRRSRPVARQGGVARLWGLCRALLLVALRGTLALGALAALAAVVVYLRLLQGPIALPGIAAMLARQVNASAEQVRLDVGDVVLTLGEGAATSGLQFRDVRLLAPDGQILLAAPRVGARFHLSDLAQGRLQPVRITLIEPDAQVIRAADGRVRVGLGEGAGVALPRTAGEGARVARVAELVDGLVGGLIGDRAPLPELARLERVEILGANLTFDDRLGETHWMTEHADLRLWRYPGGVRAALDIQPRRKGGAAVRLVADRPAGPGRTDLRLQFEGLEAGRLAAQARELDWLRLIGGTVGGEASATLERDGSLGALEGAIAAADGTLRGLGRPVPFDAAELHFRAEPGQDRLAIERFRLEAPAFSATLAGYADIERAPGGTVSGLSGQFDIGALGADLPDIFARPLAFDGGEVTLAWSWPARRIRVAGARLTRGPLAVTLDAEVRGGADGWITDMRVEAAGMTAEDLVSFWPLSRAANARDWLDRHLVAGSIDRLTAQLRLGGSEPLVALDFAYSGLTVDYVDGMSPVEAARGIGHVSLHDLWLDVEAGRLAPGPGQPVDLAGSTVAIRGFWGGTPPAEIAVRATGPIDSVLTIVDQKPLRLLSRSGRRLDPIEGAATLAVDLVIPLKSTLRLADIGVEARAALSDVSTRFAISPGRAVDLRAARLELVADKTALGLTGPTLIEGAPVALDWRESYGPGADGRTIDLSGKASEALLAAIGAGGLPVAGSPPFDLRLRQAAGGPLGFTLDADLGPAGVEIAALDWVKPPGVPARLRAEGTQEKGVAFRALTLEGAGLDLAGSLALDAEGRLARAEFATVRLAGLGTFSAMLRPAPDGVLEIALRGRELDLSGRIDDAGGDGGTGTATGREPATPVRILLDVGRLALGARIALVPASGSVERHASGAVRGRFEGRLGAAPAALEFDLPADAPGTLTLDSADAGAALRATGFYSDAEGGTLSMTAAIGAGDGAGLSGEMLIRDVRIRSQSTFRSMLRDGGLDSAEEAVSSGGIGFRKVVVPFTYGEGRLRLRNAIASSPLLALKVSGTVDERRDLIDLAGVLSPAYGLTGALNEVPLLGQILGGEGEGVLAMTFRLDGSVNDPRFTVNPLSMLAPGFLRKIFTAPKGEVSESFRDNITPQNR